ncbi:MAG: hypothetical protein J6U98_09465 [Abditibacteriota bacterium]|nr:hypothetical protein [Abditibacteriota bacterium]MBP5093540.1 hypothetical protein [Abditibacteriota bacterium]
MIKLNLLPKVVDEKKDIRNMIILFSVLLLAVLAGCFAYIHQLDVNIADMKAKEAEARMRKENVDRIKAEAESWEGKIPPVKAKVDFFDSVMAYTDAYPKLYEEIARWTYNRVQYNAISTPAPDAVVMAAKAKNLDDVGRYLLNMYKATNLFTEVTISGVPGYGQMEGGDVGFDFGALNEQAAAESTPPPASGGMTQEQLAASFPGRDVSGVTNVGTGGAAAPAPAAPAQSYQAPSLAGLGAIDTGVLRAPGAGVPKEINFTVNCKLKEPINVPTPPGTQNPDEQPM